MGVFHVIKLYKWYQIAQRTTWDALRLFGAICIILKNVRKHPRRNVKWEVTLLHFVGLALKGNLKITLLKLIFQQNTVFDTYGMNLFTWAICDVQ